MRIVADLSLVSVPMRAHHRWTPARLFASAVGAWFDPSDLSTLFQDAAGTQPVTADGQPVGLMLDKSGNGHHMTQPSAALRPTWRTDGARAWLEMDGVDDRMSAPGPVFTAATLNAVAGLAYDTVPDARWGGLRSRVTAVTVGGTSHPTTEGAIQSNVGGSYFVNGAPAPATRPTLRAALLSPAVLEGRGMSATTGFSGAEWQTLTHWNLAPPAGRLYGYVDYEGAAGDEIGLLRTWMAGKTGVSL